MNKKYQCNICGEKPCTFSVNDSANKPFACPFDKKHDANWIEMKNRTVSFFVDEAKTESQIVSVTAESVPVENHAHCL